MSHNGVPGRASALLMMVSFILSLMLWLQVTAQTEPNKQREMLIRVDHTNLNPAYYLLDIPDGVTVIVEGSEAALEALEPGSLSASVDLAGLKPGTHMVRIQMPELRRPLTARPKRPSVQVIVDRLITVTLPVSVEERGQLQAGLRFEGVNTEPETVTVTGPAKEVSRVKRVRAMLDLMRIRPSQTEQVDLEALSADGTPVTRVDLTPKSVVVLPAVSAAEESRELPIAPTWNGQLPYPFRIKKYTLEPGVIEIKGPSGELAKRFSIDTEPIDLAGLRQNKTIAVKLRLPQGLSVVKPTEIKILIEVERQR